MKTTKQKHRSLIIYALISIILLVFIFYDLTKAVSHESQEIFVTIPAGSSNLEIAQLLTDKKVIKNKFAFILLSKFLGYDKSLKAGDYVLDSSWSLTQVLEELSRGQIHTVTFTIPEGYTIEQMAEKLSKEGIVSKDKFLSLSNSSSFDFPFVNNVSNVDYLLEGYLFPDTYQATTQMDESDIIKMMLDRFGEVYSEEWQNRAKEMGLTDHELITIASMIEKEAKFDVDRPLIASVIYNRLKIGMLLQIDATVQFALEKQKARLTYKDLEVNSPYNTYKNYGLPPGPIGAPGRASIEAALYPAETDFLYYLAKKDGTHVFSKTFAEHQAAKAKYLK